MGEIEFRESREYRVEEGGEGEVNSARARQEKEEERKRGRERESLKSHEDNCKKCERPLAAAPASTARCVASSRVASFLARRSYVEQPPST